MKPLRPYKSLKGMTEEEKEQRRKEQRKASYERYRDERIEYHRKYYRRLKELAQLHVQATNLIET